MPTGLLLGLNREDAARFPFLLSTPIILGAGLIKFPEISSLFLSRLMLTERAFSSNIPLHRSRSCPLALNVAELCLGS
ncbi:MAG: undecaprenyl-diphosphate phosphatase [Syntrophomonadaceae bacterium]|nr:undecaprenyl-diphosphate phosphatase [Syntrophomonadaceae bacterium]